MTARFRVAELVDHGVTVLVELVEQDNRLQYEVTGPRFLARLPHCGCDLPGCAGEGVWGRRCREFTDPGGKQAHGRQACLGVSGGYHEDHAVALAKKVLASFRVRKTKPGVVTGGARVDPNRPVSYPQFVQLDGEEAVDLYSLKTRSDGSGEPETVAARVVCYSRRCVETVTGTRTDWEDRQVEVTRQRQWSRLVVELPGTAYDFKDDSARDLDPRIEGRNPFEVRNEHIAWHRETFGTHPRVALDRWIHDHAMTAVPEPDRAELDRQLATAKAEREEMVAKKIGTRVRLKPSVGSYATTGVIREVYGKGESALYEVDTVDQEGYRKTERLMRGQFTLAGAR